MCKKYETITTVIEQAKEDTPDVFAVYEPGRDLVGLVKVYNRVLAILYDVAGDGELSYFRKGRVRGELDWQTVKRLFGLDEPGLRSLYRVVPC